MFHSPHLSSLLIVPSLHSKPSSSNMDVKSSLPDPQNRHDLPVSANPPQPAMFPTCLPSQAATSFTPPPPPRTKTKIGRTIIVNIYGTYRAGGPLGGKASYGVFFNEGSDYNTAGYLPPSLSCKSYIAQIYAAQRAIELVEDVVSKEVTGITGVVIRSQSEYVVKCFTEWTTIWEENGWINSYGKPVVNRAGIEKVVRLIRESKIERGVEIKFELVGKRDNKQPMRLAETVFESEPPTTQAIHQPWQAALKYWAETAHSVPGARRLCDRLNIYLCKIAPGKTIDIVALIRRLVVTGEDHAANFELIFGPEWKAAVLQEWSIIRIQVLNDAAEAGASRTVAEEIMDSGAPWYRPRVATREETDKMRCPNDEVPNDEVEKKKNLTRDNMESKKQEDAEVIARTVLESESKKDIPSSGRVLMYPDAYANLLPTSPKEKGHRLVNNDPEAIACELEDEAHWKYLDKYVKQEEENRFRCKVPGCCKLFQAKHFWRKHARLRHTEVYGMYTKVCDPVGGAIASALKSEKGISNETGNKLDESHNTSTDRSELVIDELGGSKEESVKKIPQLEISYLPRADNTQLPNKADEKCFEEPCTKDLPKKTFKTVGSHFYPTKGQISRDLEEDNSLTATKSIQDTSKAGGEKRPSLYEDLTGETTVKVGNQTEISKEVAMDTEHETLTTEPRMRKIILQTTLISPPIRPSDGKSSTNKDPVTEHKIAKTNTAEESLKKNGSVGEHEILEGGVSLAQDQDDNQTSESEEWVDVQDMDSD
ncbi:hypothetical protein B0O99DRAFT_627512 [Bisporella sp. PMI_857]|nr:hypothetical protein B0O99DRAFT_627512 [Bisporella sp. PMI_857]